VYVVAVLHRTSFGVVGVEAVERYAVSATVLSSFVVVQVAVYAALQVPMGLLLDRFGSRALLVLGALLMAAGQLWLALADDVAGALAGRVLVGAGDAATFISVLRLVALWFPAHRAPLFTQLTGLVGQLGQVASAVPVVAVLHVAGWTPTFVGLAVVGLVAAIAAAAGVRDAPAGTRVVPGAGGLVMPLRAVLGRPGTWLGVSTHAVTQFPQTVFVLLWGFPFLTVAQGLSPATAGLLLTVNVATVAVTGPVVGILTGRHPLRRSWMVLATAVAVAAVWAAVLVRTEPSPLWLLVLLVVVTAVGGPASAIGFDYARTANPPQRLGTATAVVNGGGFAVAVVGLLAVGVVLDAASRAGAGPLSLEAFRWGFGVLVVPWALVLAGVLVSRARTRATMRVEGVVVPPLREVVARHRGRRTGGRDTSATTPPKG
jgi:nitrate/nitrite transporter NarK